jgi:hypothetical protein
LDPCFFKFLLGLLKIIVIIRFERDLEPVLGRVSLLVVLAMSSKVGKVDSM